MTVVIVLISALCVVTIYPFLFVLFYSISEGVAVVANPITFYPRKLTFLNYRTVFASGGILSATYISVARTVVGGVLHVVVTGLAAYAVSKHNLIFRKFFLVFFIITMYFSGGLLPTYVVVIKLGLGNRFLVYILPLLYSGFHMLIMKVFFEQVPASLEESAVLDGAGDLRIFSQIFVPLSTPVVATILLFAGVMQWNSWFDAFLYVSDLNLCPLQTMLHKILREAQPATMFEILQRSMSGPAQANTVTSESIKMTVVMIATVPILLSYPFLQRYFTKGLMIGAVKG
jgi:putative aldouronate transport system permease protein